MVYIDKIIGLWCFWIPIMTLLVYWIVIKVFKGKKNKLISIFFNSIPIGIALTQLFTPIIMKSFEEETLILGFFYFTVTILQVVLEQYNKLLPKTKESYKFNKQYNEIQSQWDLIETNNVDKKTKSFFVEDSLKSIESSLIHPDVQKNEVVDKKIKEFVKTVGSVSSDYILLCSNNNVVYNKIFAWLYKYLFVDYKKKVLSPIQSTSTGTVDLIIPEFVSNGLTQAIINNENDVQYQHNTSVVRTLSEFKNNVEAGTELKGNIGKIKNKKKNFLQRIIINDEFKEASRVVIVERIIKWHEKSNVDLRFISTSTAEEIKNNYSTVERLDFSVIKMVNESEYFILGADKIKNSYFAGQWHEMYSVKCASYSEEPESNKLFDDLWEKAETATPEYANGVLSKITFNNTSC